MPRTARPLGILGIDPGTGTTGFGVIDVQGATRTHVAHGVIRTTPRTPLPDRLAIIADDVRALFDRYAPDEAAVELLFFAKNVTTAMMVAQARGVILAEIGRRGVPIAEFSPPQVKESVTGDGRAGKPQVQEMVRRLLRLRVRPRPDDAADALAVALAHASRRNAPTPRPR